MSGHTPGPWRLFQQRGGRWLDIRSDNGAQIVAEVTAILGESARSEANARLIAAAPDLLEALLALRVRDDSPLGDCWCPAEYKHGREIKDHEHTAECCLTRAALSKASGSDTDGKE